MGAELMITEATALGFDRHPQDGRIALAMMERLWLMPAEGGAAVPLTPAGLRLSRPRFSPDGGHIVAEGDWRDDRSHLWRIATDSGAAERLMAGDWRDMQASWHPGGKRLLFVSDRAGSDDIWEYDVDTDTARRLTTLAGAETWPAYSSDGERLIFISESAGNFALMRQYYAGRPETLFASDQRLSAPAARRGGVLITFIERRDDGGQALRMLLPVREMLVKTLIDGADLAEQPIVWRDRNHYLVALDGKLEQRELAGRARQTIDFTAWLSIQPSSGGEVITVIDDARPGAPATSRQPPRPIVLRAARLFDAASQSYRFEQDVLIEAGRIAAVVPRRQWPERQVIDMGDASLVPGLIDIDTGTGAAADAPHGRQLLAAGITTLARATPGSATDAALPAWRDGPRVIGLGTVVDVRGVADRRERIAALNRARADGYPAITDRLLPDLTLGPAMLSATALPPSFPAKPLYADLRGLLEKSAVRIVAGVTPLSGWTAQDWQRLRASRLFVGPSPGAPAGSAPASGGETAAAADASAGMASLPPALTLAAELITLQRSGAPAATILAGATIGAANVLRRNDLGRIEVGALADMVVVSGDPLEDIAALIDPVAVISRGQFMSAAGLLDGIGDR